MLPGPLQNSCSRELFREDSSILKKNSNIDVLLGSSQKFSEQLLFWITNGLVLLKTKTTSYLEHQWAPLNGWIENFRETGVCCKVILMLNNYAQEEWWGVLDMDILFLKKKTWKSKISILQWWCQCWWW